MASLCGVAAESLGKKGKSGVLKSVATRKAFLTEASHRVRFVYVPKHTSWLNPVGIWFSVLASRVLRRGGRPVGGGPTGEDHGVHRVPQLDARRAVQVDLHRPTP